MNRSERILLLSNNLWILADGMLGPFYAVFSQKIGGSLLDISYGWAIYSVATGCCMIIFGRISDQLDKRKMLVLGYLFSALLTFGYLLVRTPLELFVLQAGLGIALALINPSWYALYAKYEDKRKDGYAWGLFDGESKIIGGFAVLAGGILIKYTSFEWLFISMGCIQLLATAAQYKMVQK